MIKNDDGDVYLVIIKVERCFVLSQKIFEIGRRVSHSELKGEIVRRMFRYQFLSNFAHRCILMDPMYLNA